VQTRLDAAHACERPTTTECIQESERRRGRSAAEKLRQVGAADRAVLGAMEPSIADGNGYLAMARAGDAAEAEMHKVQRKTVTTTGEGKERMGSS
jgi:hypothetical protein